MTIVKSYNVGEVKIKYRTEMDCSKLEGITQPEEAVKLFRSIWDIDEIEHVEECYILLLNGANKPVGWAKVSKGGLCDASVDVRVIFQFALLCNACSIILAHNHPSGGLAISESDKKVTRQVRAAGEVLGIKLIDHIILTRWEFVSMERAGALQ